jgi:oxygen-independent coproporphyrinogen-3 oxidase
MNVSLPPEILPHSACEATAVKTHAAAGLNIVPQQVHVGEGAYFAAVTDDPLVGAFHRKVGVHAGMGGKPIAKDTVPAQLERLRSTLRSGPAAAYVHVPFCENMCLYCGFFGGGYTEESGKAYLEALIGEVESEAGCESVGSSPINALYIGGGTPTALPPHDLTRLLQTLRARLPLANDCEITVECRIHNMDNAMIDACLSGGANRFSIGVQSFDTDLRRRIGRFSNEEDVCRRLEALSAYNQAAVIIDLMYGLPGQTMRHWERDIATFFKLPLDGVDLYQLNVFPGNALAKGIEAGKLPAPATLAEQGHYFARGTSLMRDARCRRLSVSHWGSTARERNIYNPLPKRRADCLHYGAGAGGSLQGWFILNETNPELYIQRTLKKEKPVAMMAAPPENLATVRVILGQIEECRLNLDDIDTAMAQDAGKDAAQDARSLYAPLFENWEEAGLITRDGPWVEPTLAGQFWQVNLAQALLGWQRNIH